MRVKSVFSDGANRTSTIVLHEDACRMHLKGECASCRLLYHTSKLLNVGLKKLSYLHAFVLSVHSRKSRPFLALVCCRSPPRKFISLNYSTYEYLG